jgi:hypothetical protein
MQGRSCCSAGRQGTCRTGASHRSSDTIQLHTPSTPQLLKQRCTSLHDTQSPSTAPSLRRTSPHHTQHSSLAQSGSGTAQQDTSCKTTLHCSGCNSQLRTASLQTNRSPHRTSPHHTQHSSPAQSGSGTAQQDTSCKHHVTMLQSTGCNCPLHTPRSARSTRDLRSTYQQGKHCTQKKTPLLQSTILRDKARKETPALSNYIAVQCVASCTTDAAAVW